MPILQPCSLMQVCECSYLNATHADDKHQLAHEQRGEQAEQRRSGQWAQIGKQTVY